MLRGVIQGAMALRAQVANQEVIANNLANAGTAAYQKDVSVQKSFQDVLMYRLDNSGQNSIGMSTGGSIIRDVLTFSKKGAVETTQNPLDIALSEGCYLSLSTPFGARYTRRGDLEVDPQGFLSVCGFQVLGEKGPIEIEDPQEVVFEEDGSVILNGVLVDKLKLVSFPDEKSLSKEGSSLFKANQGGEIKAFEPKVYQGMIEKSTVDVVAEMVSLISTMRFYEAAQKALKSHDEALEQAVNRVGRVI